MTAKLTAAQERMLADVRKYGERRYNGRARTQIERLAELGLTEYDYTFRFVGMSGRTSDLYTVRPKSPTVTSVDLVVIPRRYGGMQRAGESLVLAYRGSYGQAFSAPNCLRDASTVVLAWNRAGKAWEGRMEGYRSQPAQLCLTTYVDDGQIVRECETVLQSGGRLSIAAVRKHAAAIDAAFGCKVSDALNTNRTVKVTP